MPISTVGRHGADTHRIQTPPCGGGGGRVQNGHRTETVRGGGIQAKTGGGDGCYIEGCPGGSGQDGDLGRGSEASEVKRWSRSPFTQPVRGLYLHLGIYLR